MSTEPTTQKVAKPKKEAKAPFDDLYKALDNLSPEDRVELNEQGFVIPQLGGLTGDGKVKKVYGYWCPNCNGIGLEFIGSSFIDPNTGAESELPPLHVPIERLPWNQPDLDIQEVDRIAPICMDCRVKLHFEGQMRFLKPDYLRNLKDWAKSRLIGRDRPALKARLKEINKGQAGDGDLPRSYDEPDSNASTRLNPDTGQPFISPERLEAIKDVAAKTGLDDLRGGH